MTALVVGLMLAALVQPPAAPAQPLPAPDLFPGVRSTPAGNARLADFQRRMTGPLPAERAAVAGAAAVQGHRENTIQKMRADMAKAEAESRKAILAEEATMRAQAEARRAEAEVRQVFILAQPPVAPLPPANPPVRVEGFRVNLQPPPAAPEPLLHPITMARGALAGAAAVFADRDGLRQRALADRAKDEARLRAVAVQAQAQAQARLIAVQQNRNVWNDQQFENWALGEARTLDGARRRLDTLLALQVDEIDRVCQLTAAQKQKVRLMGWGDAKRVLDDFDAAKRQFNELGNDVGRIQEVMPQVQRIQGVMRSGPFQAGSLVAKSLPHALTPEQAAKYEAVARERRAGRHRAQLALTVATFEESVPLTDAQRTALLALLEAETRPVATGGQYDIYLLYQQFDRIPAAKLFPILSAGQLKAWTGMAEQYRPAIQNLRRQGLLKDDDDTTGAAKP